MAKKQTNEALKGCYERLKKIDRAMGCKGANIYELTLEEERVKKMIYYLEDNKSAKSIYG